MRERKQVCLGDASLGGVLTLGVANGGENFADLQILVALPLQRSLAVCCLFLSDRGRLFDDAIKPAGDKLRLIPSTLPPFAGSRAKVSVGLSQVVTKVGARWLTSGRMAGASDVD